jgi:hypothetical protein
MRNSTAAATATHSDSESLLSQDLGSRKVVADFSGGDLSSDGGSLLLRQTDRGLGVCPTLAPCFRDERNVVFVDHSLEALLAQRVYGLALGYEDLNDHASLRQAVLLAVAAGKQDPLGRDRFQDQGHALAAPSTLNRLEISNTKKTRYHKLTHDPWKARDALPEMGIRCLLKDAREIILDPDYLLGLAKNPVLVGRLAPQLMAGASQRCLCGLSSARAFAEFSYQTGKSWSRERRVAGKAEVTAQGHNPRFVMTNLPATGFQDEAQSAERLAARSLDENVYGERGNMENVLKQQVLDLQADRMSTQGLATDQPRLRLATFANLLLERIRALGLHGTELANATAGTIRLESFNWETRGEQVKFSSQALASVLGLRSSV